MKFLPGEELIPGIPARLGTTGLVHGRPESEWTMTQKGLLAHFSLKNCNAVI